MYVKNWSHIQVYDGQGKPDWVEVEEGTEYQVKVLKEAIETAAQALEMKSKIRSAGAKRTKEGMNCVVKEEKFEYMEEE